jgi:hypothetical protein
MAGDHFCCHPPAVSLIWIKAARAAAAQKKNTSREDTSGFEIVARLASPGRPL